MDTNTSQKLIIYQVFPRLWGNQTTAPVPNGTIEENGCGKFSAFDNKRLEKLRSLGLTHIWLTGAIRHASQTDYSAYGVPAQHPDVVKGRAGSPYAIADYYDVSPDLADCVPDRMKEFEALVQRIHKAGMGVILDFVPNHVAREYRSVNLPEGETDLGQNDRTDHHFNPENNFYYCWGQPFQPEFPLSTYQEQPAKATGNDRFDNHPTKNDWYETVKLNYGVDYCDAGGRSEHFHPVPNTWHRMLHILQFWASKGVDGFRCDMIFMVPPAFWAWAIPQVRAEHPAMLFIGEIYQPEIYRQYIAAGFDYLYDKVGMYDCLKDILTTHRPTADITQQWQTVDDIRQHMLYFMENHDELRIASRQFAGQAERGLPAVMVSVWLSRNPFIIYYGQEVGENAPDSEGYSGADGRTTIFDYWSLERIQRAYFAPQKQKKAERDLWKRYQQIFTLAHAERALAEGESYDLMYCNPNLSQRQFAFVRKADGEAILAMVNFAEEAVKTEVRLPEHAFAYLQLPQGSVAATDLLSGKQHTLTLQPDVPNVLELPPLGAVLLKFNA